MSNPITEAINKFVYDFTSGSFKEYIRQMLNHIHIEAQHMALVDVINSTEIEFKSLFDEAVSGFYDSYDPQIYDRNESLKRIFKFTNEGESFSTEFDEFGMSQFERGRAGGLYNLTFKEGYHGGGGSPPRYRGPINIWSHWTGSAVQSNSPYEVWYNSASSYWNTVSSEKYNKLYNDYFNQMIAKAF